MTLAERVAPVARTIADARLGRRVRRTMPAISRTAADPVDHVADAIARIAENIAGTAEHVSDDASKETRNVTRDIGEALSEAIGAVTSAAGDAAARAGGAARDLHLDDRVEDVVKRIRTEFPTERITSLVATLERELPTTDKDRYDRAYVRGWTRARAAFIGVGLAAGVAAGIAGAFLLDPQQGPRRRAAIRSRATGIGTAVTGQARATATRTVEQVRGLATERGLIKRDADTELAETLADAAAAPMVPVMDVVGSTVETIEDAAPDGGTAEDVIAQLSDEGAPVPANPVS